jgi:hypothetical protein
MSEGALDRKKFEAIETYLLGTMAAEERARFEAEMKADAVLRAEVELQHENMMAVELGGMTRTLRSIAAEEQAADEGSQQAGGRRYWMYAAAILLIGIGAAWWFTRAPLNEQVFAEHFVADPGLPVEMGVTKDPVFADAMVAYKLGDYAEARHKWSELLITRPQNDTLSFYIASAALAAGDTEAAIAAFQGPANEPSSIFHGRSRWFLFLAYVRGDRIAEAEALQLNNDPVYGEGVRAILDQLKK